MLGLALGASTGGGCAGREAVVSCETELCVRLASFNFLRLSLGTCARTLIAMIVDTACKKGFQMILLDSYEGFDKVSKGFYIISMSILLGSLSGF